MNEQNGSSDEELRALIDQFFGSGEAPSKGPTRKLKEPDLPPMSLGEEAEAIRIAMKEMEAIRLFFLAFQNEIGGSPLYPYLYPHIEEFAEIAGRLEEVIQDDIDVDSLSGEGKSDYELLMKLRRRILNEVYKKHRE